MSTATKTILIIVKNQGLDQANTAIKSLATTSGAATKATNGLGTAFQKGQGGALKLRTGVFNLDKAEMKATKSTDTFGKSTDTAGKKTTGLAAKFQGNKGAIFAFTGMAAAGMEAVGMFGMYQSAADKLSDAQERVNMLEQAGAQGTKEYKDAVSDVAEAQRGYNFILRNVAMSFGDLVPFTLLAINAIVKMKDTVTSSKPALDAATQATTGLGNAANTSASGGLTGLFNKLGQVVTGTKNYDTGLKTANTTTGTFNNALGNLQTGFTNTNTKVLDATRLIGTGNNGLVGGVSGLTTNMDKSNKMSTKFQDAFKKIGGSIKNLPTTFKNVGSSILSFFTNFGTNITKFGGLLKVAGTAAMAFSKTLLLAFLSNPITAIIAGISAAVLALATDFGGVRTAINNAGVALGNAIPQAKGILQAFGDMANGALDFVSNAVGVERNTKAMGAAAVAAAKDFEPLKKSMQVTLTVSKGFDEARQGIENLAMGTSLLKNTVAGIDTWHTALLNSLTTTQKQGPEAQKALTNLKKVVEESQKPNVDLATVKKNLNDALLQVQLAVMKEEIAQAKNATTTEKAAGSSDKFTKSTTGMSAEVKSFVAQLSLANATGETHKTIIEENATKLLEWTQKMGLNINTTKGVSASIKAWAAEMIPIAPALDEIGTQIAYTEGEGINWVQTLKNIGATQEEVTTMGTNLFNSMKVAVKNLGADAFPIIEGALERLKGIYPEVFEVAQKLWNDEKEKMIENGQFVEELGELKKKKSKETKTEQEKYNEKLAEEAKELQFTAERLGIYNEILGLSTESQKVAVQFTEDHNSAMAESRATLQKLALARGLDKSELDATNTELLEHIKNNKLAKITEDEITVALAELIAAREEDARAARLQGLVAREWIAGMKETIPVTQMTGEGLMKLAETYADVKNASGIAADQIGLWYAELKKGDAIEQASIEKMLELADGIGVEIPNSIKDSVPDMQNYVQQILRIGDAAKKMKEQALAAFDELNNKAKSGLEKIFSEALGEDGDNIKKALKALDKVGKGIDSLNAKQIVIDAFLNDDEYENGIDSLSEIMEREYGDLATLSQSQGFNVGDTFAETLRDAVGKKGKPIADQVDTIWQQVKASAQPGESGNEIIGRFAEALKKAGIVEAAIKAGATDPVLAELGLIPPQVAKTGTAITSQLGSSLKAGANTVANEAQQSLRDPVIQNAELIPGEAGTAVAPIEGVFSNAFLKASTAATGQINMLLADITLSMGYLVTNVGTKLTEIVGLWNTHATNVGVAIDNINLKIQLLQTQAIEQLTKLKDFIIAPVIPTWELLMTTVGTVTKTMTENIGTLITTTTKTFGAYMKLITEVQKTFSTLSTSVATYMKSMTTNVQNFANSAKTSFNSVSTSTKTANTALSTLSKSVATYSNSMKSNLKSFSSSAVSSLNAVASAAKKAESALKSMAAAAAKAKAARSGLRFGGAFVMGGQHMNQSSSFAQQGKSWINSRPRKIGGVNISEFSKPELVTVTPLSNPSDPMDKGLNYLDGLPGPKMQSIPSNMSGGGGGVGGNTRGQPITVTGNLNVVVKTQNGKVLAQEVQPYLFEGFSGVT